MDTAKAWEALILKLTPLLDRVLSAQVIETTADGVVTVITATLVGCLNYSSLIGVIVGGLVGFALSPSALNVGQNGFPSS